MGIKKKSPKVQLLRSLFESIRKNVKLWDCWQTTEQWINVMNSFFPEAADFEFTKGDLGRMLATDPVYKHCFMQYGSHTNQHGLYIDKFKKRQYLQHSNILLPSRFDRAKTPQRRKMVGRGCPARSFVARFRYATTNKACVGHNFP